MTFARQMKALRLLRGVTQQELAAATGIPANYLSVIETGRVIPAPGGAWDRAIRGALDWPLDELFQPATPDAC
jgi:transcriptional regulator with XRE-family HTH domain